MAWTFLLLMLILAVLLALPMWPYARAWGYYPSGIFTALVVVVLALAALGYVVLWHPWTVGAY
jgi:hypothetical protein